MTPDDISTLLAAAFLAGCDAGWDDTGEGHNGEYTRRTFTAEKYEAQRQEALAKYRSDT